MILHKASEYIVFMRKKNQAYMVRLCASVRRSPAQAEMEELKKRAILQQHQQLHVRAGAWGECGFAAHARQGRRTSTTDVRHVLARLCTAFS